LGPEAHLTLLHSRLQQQQDSPHTSYIRGKEEAY
jgi:hypothetical protein